MTLWHSQMFFPHADVGRCWVLQVWGAGQDHAAQGSTATNGDKT